jgi:hypothetical protein
MKRIPPALRHIQPGDAPFLFQVYASTRLGQLALLGWSADEQAAFLTQQFNAQHQHYHFPRWPGGHKGRDVGRETAIDGNQGSGAACRLAALNRRSDLNP